MSSGSSQVKLMVLCVWVSLCGAFLVRTSAFAAVHQGFSSSRIRLFTKHNHPRRLNKEFYESVQSQQQAIRKQRVVASTALISLASLTGLNGLVKAAKASPTALSLEELTRETGDDLTKIIKSPLDDRTYRALTLPNGLRVTLVSDPAMQKAAAALDVHVGSYANPVDLPGLAHFCEHMLFLGTKKYPDENEFSTYLSDHGGSSNAYTDSEDTAYYFDVSADQLPGALDRFAQFFIAPLFTPSATDREINAIDSEHSKNINDDGFRLFQLEKDLSNPAHPMHQFATGNLLTLSTTPKAQGINVREALLHFYETYYSANLMALSVLGKEPLDRLEALVRQSFGAVRNTNAPVPADQLFWGEINPLPPLLDSSSLNKAKEHATKRLKYAQFVQVVPVTPLRTLSIVWYLTLPTLSLHRTLQQQRPDLLLAHLLGHEGRGSLRSLLVDECGWANGLSAYLSHEQSDLQAFEVHVDLTSQGFQHQDQVIAAVFAYLDMLQGQMDQSKTTLPGYLSREVQQITWLSFLYAERRGAMDTVLNLATTMQQPQFRCSDSDRSSPLPASVSGFRPESQTHETVCNGPRDYLLATSVYRGTSPDVLREYLWRLSPYAVSGAEERDPTLPSEMIRITTVAQEYAGSITDNNSDRTSGLQQQSAWQTQPYYGTRYRVETRGLSLSDSDLRRYQKALTLPRPNSLLPQQLAILRPSQLTPLDRQTRSPKFLKRLLEAIPLRIRQDEVSTTNKVSAGDHWTLFHYTDDIFDQPRVHCVFLLRTLSSPSASSSEEAHERLRSRLLVDLFLEGLTEYLYEAQLAGLQFSLEHTSRGLQFFLTGFSDRIVDFTEEILKQYVLYESELQQYQAQQSTNSISRRLESRFERLRDLLSRDLGSWDAQQPYEIADYYLTRATETQHSSVETLRGLVQTLSLQNVAATMEESATGQRKAGVASNGSSPLQRWAASGHVGLCLGNLQAETALQLSQLFDRYLLSNTLTTSRSRPLEERSLPRQLVLYPLSTEVVSTDPSKSSSSRTASVSDVAEGRWGHLLWEPAPYASRTARSDADEVVDRDTVEEDGDRDGDGRNTAVRFSFQLPSVAPQDYVLFDLLAQLLEPLFYNELRTKQQLGYLVFSQTAVRNGVHHWECTVQANSAKYSVVDLIRAVEGFLVDIAEPLIFGREQTVKERKDSSKKQKSKKNGNEISPLTEESWANGALIASYIARKKEPLQRLSQQANRYWSEIQLAELASIRRQNHAKEGEKDAGEVVEPLWQRGALEAQQASTSNVVALTRLRQLYAQSIGFGGSERRLIVTAVDGRADRDGVLPQPREKDREVLGRYHRITDIDGFRRARPFI